MDGLMSAFAFNRQLVFRSFLLYEPGGKLSISRIPPGYSVFAGINIHSYQHGRGRGRGGRPSPPPVTAQARGRAPDQDPEPQQNASPLPWRVFPHLLPPTLCPAPSPGRNAAIHFTAPSLGIFSH